MLRIGIRRGDGKSIIKSLGQAFSKACGSRAAPVPAEQREARIVQKDQEGFGKPYQGVSQVRSTNKLNSVEKKTLFGEPPAGEIPEAPPVADEARGLSEKTGSNDAAPRRQCDHVFEGHTCASHLRDPRRGSLNNLLRFQYD